jgi:hypothetical protein
MAVAFWCLIDTARLSPASLSRYSKTTNVETRCAKGPIASPKTTLSGIGLVTALVLAFQRRWVPVARLGGRALIGAGELNLVLKDIFRRLRPRWRGQGRARQFEMSVTLAS